MKILMSGITGFIGRNWLQKLIETHDVIGLGRTPSADQACDFLRNRTEYISMDLEKPLDIQRLPKTVDAVIHLAQGANGRSAEARHSMFRINLAATQELSAYAAWAGAKVFFYASTGNVYAPTLSPLTEQSPLDHKTQDYYTYTKIAAERFLELSRRGDDSHPEVIIARLFVPYGPGQTGRMIPKLIERVQNQQEITLTNDGQPHVNPIFITDLCNILSALLSQKKSCTVNVGGDTTYSVREIVEMIGRAGDWPVRFKTATSKSAFNLIGKSTVLTRLIGGKVATPTVDLALGLGRMLAARTHV